MSEIKQSALQHLQTLLERESSGTDYETYINGIESDDISEVKDVLSFIYDRMTHAKCEAYAFSLDRKIDTDYKNREELTKEMYQYYLEMENKGY